MADDQADRGTPSLAMEVMVTNVVMGAHPGRSRSCGCDVHKR